MRTGGIMRYVRRMWTVGRNQPDNQLDAVFEDVPGLERALDRLVILKQQDERAHVWARGPFYDIEAQLTGAGEIGFVVRPSVEIDHDLPTSCQPFNKAELLALAADDTQILSGEEECPTCRERRRGRYANSTASGTPLFLCSTCEHWTETLPIVRKPGHPLRRSDLAG